MDNPRRATPSGADLQRLRSVGLFASLPPEALSALLGEASILSAPPAAFIFQQDQEAEHLVVVLDGLVGLMATVDRHDSRLIELAHPGQVIGEAGLFDSGRHPVAAQAITEARLALIPAAILRTLLDADAGLRRAMLGFLSARLRVLVRQIAQLKLMSASQRLGSFLLGLTPRRPGRQTIQLPCERRVIAGMLGMTPESLSRSLRQLADLGVSGEGRSALVIAEPERLRAFVAGEGA